jgi:hypothetical protein
MEASSGRRRLGHVLLALAAVASVSGLGTAYPPASNPLRQVQAALVPSDTLYNDLAWPALSAGLPAAWDATLGEPSITIAVVDTGVNPVPDLAGALVPG